MCVNVSKINCMILAKKLIKILYILKTFPQTKIPASSVFVRKEEKKVRSCKIIPTSKNLTCIHKVIPYFGNESV